MVKGSCTVDWSLPITIAEEGHDFVHVAQIPLLGTWVVCFHGTIFFKFKFQVMRIITLLGIDPYSRNRICEISIEQRRYKASSDHSARAAGGRFGSSSQV